MVVCLLSKHNILCVLYIHVIHCLVHYSLLKSTDLTNCEKAFKYLPTSSLFGEVEGGGANPSSGRYMLYHGNSLGFQYSAYMD